MLSNKNVDNAYEKIVKVVVADSKDREYIKLVLGNLYAEGQVDGMRDMKRIWEK